MTSGCDFFWTSSNNTSLPLVLAAGITVGLSTGVSLGMLVGVVARIITGIEMVFGEISGENILPLLVILLVPTILTTS